MTGQIHCMADGDKDAPGRDVCKDRAGAALNLEVICALPRRTVRVALRVPAGTTVREAIVQSGIALQLPGFDVTVMPCGVYGQKIARPQTCPVHDGDRIELYRPLITGPGALRCKRVKLQQGSTDRNRDRAEREDNK